MKTLNPRISGMAILALILSSIVSFAQLNESTNTTNLTTQPGSTGGSTYHSVGIGLDDPNIVRRLHIRDKFPPYLPGDAGYVPYTLGIRLDFGIESEFPFNPTQYRAWDVVNRYGNFNLYNDRIGKVEFAILGSSGFTGIGTDSPQGRLDVNSGFSDMDALFVRANAAIGGMGGVIHHQSHEFAWQTLAQNTAFENNSSLRFHFTRRTSPGEKVRSDIMVLHSAGRVGINTDSPDYELDVCGTIRSKEVLVETGWCDYVFDTDYKLLPLSEVETFIAKNHHLPNIPAASVVEEKGLELADMVPRMMEKIEELTLYMIALEKEKEIMKKQLENLTLNSSKP